MTKWQYLKISEYNMQQLGETMDSLGRKGWECYTVHERGLVYFFKRELGLTTIRIKQDTK